MVRFRTGYALGAVAVLSIGLAALPAVAAENPAAVRPAAENFSIVVFPDTQYSSESFPEAFEAQAQWILDNQAARNIQYTLHEGDIVDDSDQAQQWTNAHGALDRLHSHAPFILGVGNHDMDAMPNGEDPAEVRDATAFNSNFPVSDFAGLPSFGGSFPEGQNDNSFHTFTAGGTDWLVLALKYAPTDEEIAWANQVVTDHPDHQVMIVTHAYQDGADKDTYGQKLWEQLVRKHANISFVFSGHYVNAGRITEQGDNGNTVYQIQADYQNSATLDPNSYFRVLEFNPTAKTVSVETYSPYLDNNLTDTENQFVLEDVAFLPAGK